MIFLDLIKIFLPNFYKVHQEFTDHLISPNGVVLLEACALLPKLGEYSAEEIHGLERLFGELHVCVDGVHPLLELLELFALVVEHDERLDAGVLGVLAQVLHPPRRLQRLIRHLRKWVFSW